MTVNIIQYHTLLYTSPYCALTLGILYNLSLAYTDSATNTQLGNCVEEFLEAKPIAGELDDKPGPRNWWVGLPPCAGQCVAGRFKATPVPVVPWLIVSG